MKKLLTFLVLISSLSIPRHSYAQSFQWIERMGGISSALNPGADEMVRQIQVDAFGNVYACGRIRQFADFSGTTVTTYGDYDIFLAKYNCHGGLVWVKTAGGSATDDAFSLALDGLGHIYLTGYLEADISIPNTFFDTLLTEYTTDMFLAKFDTSGNYLWGKFSGPGAQNTNAQGFNIVIDVNGNVNVHVSTATAGILLQNLIRQVHFSNYLHSVLIILLTQQIL
jgi:hypothetical protein